MSYKKSLGQNFLRCGWVVDTLIRAAGLNLEEAVLEIGPGNGVLTRALAKTAKRVIAVEKDERLASDLKNNLKKLGIQNVEIITGDILQIFREVTTSYKLKAKSYKVVSNIPYYLTSRLLKTLFESENLPSLIVLTLQKEVAQRIAARPPRMSLLALSVQVFGKPQIIKDVPRQCFYPQPNVDSSIIKIEEISGDFFKKSKISQRQFFGLLKLAFSQKRKMLIKNLAGKFGDRPKLQKIFENSGVPKTARAQELNLSQWASLTSKI